MEVYIDNKKMKLGKKKFKNLAMVFDEIRNYLYRQNRIPFSFYLNGKSILENTAINIDNLKIVEVESKSEGEILLDSILKAKEEIEKFFEIFEYDEEEEVDISTPVIVSELEIIERCIFLKKFHKLLLVIQESGVLDFVYGDFDEYVEEFASELKLAEKAFESEDYESFVEMMAYSIGDLLEDFYDKVENYYEDILWEQNRKSLPN